jgi:hypothetical protein
LLSSERVLGREGRPLYILLKTPYSFIEERHASHSSIKVLQLMKLKILFDLPSSPFPDPSITRLEVNFDSSKNRQQKTFSLLLQQSGVRHGAIGIG